MSRGRLLLAVCLGLLVLVPAAQGVSASASAPVTRIGMNYFDGWSDQLPNFHFNGLVRPGANGQFPDRRPRSGWRDNTAAAMRASLDWAHEDGVDFFYFDWSYEDPYLNIAFENYLKLKDHRGVGAAIEYINVDPFTVPQADWQAVVELWVTQAFLNPDYARVDGKPILYILDPVRFTNQWGGTAGVNAALDTLRRAAIAHGLPGVFVFGSVFMGTCVDSVGWDYFASLFKGESWDAMTADGPAATCERDGAQPYADLVAAYQRAWDYNAQKIGFPSIPTVLDGWDPRPWDERGDGHLWWFQRTPEQFGAFVSDAINWTQAHQSQAVESPYGTPLVLVSSWNELGEGNFLIPTVGTRYSYGHALAQAVGIPWAGPTRYQLSVATRGGTVRSAPSGIACPGRCRARFDSGWQVTITATPDRHHVFRGWTAACHGHGRTCSFIIERSQSVRAAFASR